MVEESKLADCLVAPLVSRGEEPGEGEDEPPQEGGHHGVVEQPKDEDARSMCPRPFPPRLHIGASRADDAAGTDDESQEVAESMDVEGEG